jgi:ABC-type nitrate/sulfonate/bicarbonate transport system permease component
MSKPHWKEIVWVLYFLMSVTGIISFGVILRLLGVNEYITPFPPALYNALTSQFWEWVKAIALTATYSFIAMVLSVFLGATIGFFASFFRLSHVDRWAQLIWSIPVIAVSTYLNIMLSYKFLYAISLGVFLGFYPIQKYVFDRCSMKSEGIISLCATFGLSRWQEFWYLKLKDVMSNLGTALSQTLPLCFIGQTMAEYMSGSLTDFSKGLGGMLLYGRNDSKYQDVWLSIIFMGALVFLSRWLVNVSWEKFFPNSKYTEDFR